MLVLLLLRGAFTAVLLLTSAVSVHSVPPPTDVTVSCQNKNVTVSWNYENLQPDISFRVKIGAETYTTAGRQWDLSAYVWKSKKRYMDIHWVSVTAVQSNWSSQPVTSKTFSYNHFKTTEKKCLLEFPPVDVKVDGSVSFQNPLEYYSGLKPDSAIFKFTVSVDKTDVEGECTAGQKTCKADVAFDDVQEKCVTLDGELFDENTGTGVKFNHTGPICAPEPSDDHELLLIIGIATVVLVVAVSITGVCVTKAWTLKTRVDERPKALEEWDHGEKKQVFFEPEETFSQVRLIVDDKFSHGSVEEDGLCNKNNNISGSSGSSSEDSECFYHERPGQYREGGLSEESDSVSTEECVLMDSEGEEEEEEEGEGEGRSAYEPRGRRVSEDRRVDIGCGEMVTTYSAR